MKRNIIETVLGGIVLLVAVGFIVFAFKSSGLSGGGSGYEVTAEFDDATGLNPGTDVRMAGVKIGTVVSQRLDPKTFFAKVTLSIDNSIELPSDTSARIVPEGLLGGNFVELEPGGDTETIAPGGEVEFTQGAVNVVDLLGRFVFSSGDKNKDGAAKE
jgi:phospholipid/cholesterol/gamma-HCH transport system substrate-binding protein